MFRAMLEPLLEQGVLIYNPKPENAERVPLNGGAGEAGTLARQILEKDIALFDRTVSTPLREEMLTNVFMPNIGGNFYSLQDEAIKRFAASRQDQVDSLKSIGAAQTLDNEGAKADYIRAYGLELLVSAMAKTVQAQREKIVGRALNAAACGETLDLLLGHTN